MEDWKKEYEAKVMTAEEAVTHIKNGDRVVIGHLVGAPVPIIEAMCRNYQAYDGVKLSSMLTSDGQPYADEKYQGHFLLQQMFVGKNTAKALAAGYGDFTPSHFSDLPYLYRTLLKPDVVVVQGSRPDSEGYISLGFTSDYSWPAAKAARTVIVEANAQCPYVFGDTRLHISEIECVVETDHVPVEIPPTKITDTERSIAGYCAELIKDGDCLQLGLGAIPDAVLGLMEDKHELGIHSEIIGDAVQKLSDMGIITGSRKEIDKGKIVSTSLYGSQALNQWADKNPVLELRPVDYTNDVRVISQISNMVSINSCVEIDLTGQICSEAVGMRQISGIGGQVDFVRGARMSKGGKSIIACYSTAKNGTISKIVPVLKEGTPVTTSRTDVDYVITEFGVAHLRGMTLKERARALIAIAHPDFREQLKADYKKYYGWTC